MKLAVAYCRVSTDFEEQKKSIREQQNQWIEFFKKADTDVKPASIGYLYRKNGTRRELNNALYVDEGISGTSLKNRHAFNQMVEDAKAGLFNVIFVEDVSRFGRSTEDGIRTIKDLREVGVLVYFRKEGWYCTPDKDFEYTLRVSISQEESQKLSQRMQWGINRLHLSGGWNATAPYGYRVENAHLKINEEQAEVVRLIFDLFLNQKFGIGKICRYLDAKGIKTQKGVKWSQPQVTRILENQIYTGEQRTHTIQSIDVTRHIKVAVPESEQIVHHFEHLRIISDDTFRKAQIERKKRLERINTGTYNMDRYLFSTVCYCGSCGAVYKRKKRHSYRRKDGTSKELGYEWTCTLNDMYGKNRCEQRMAISDEDLLKAFQRELRERKKDNLQFLYDEYIAKKEKELDIDIEDVKVKSEKVKKIVKQLRSDLIDGLISKDQYDEELKDYNDELQGYNADIQRYEQRTAIIESLKSEFKAYQKMVNDIDVENLSNAVLKTIFYKVFISYRIQNGEKIPYIRFVYNFMDTTEDDVLGSMDSVESEGIGLIWHKIYE